MSADPCRLVVDGRALYDASSYRGIGTYVREVLTGLAQDDRFQVTTLARPGAVLPPGSNPKPVLRVAPGRWQSREHDLLLPLDIARARPDVFWSPAMDPPARCSAPWVQTIQDLVPLQGDKKTVARFRAHRYPRARTIVTGSHWTASEIVRQLGIPASRVEVIPHGVHSRFSPGPRGEAPPYVLFVGEYDPRKRHQDAYAAIAGVADRGHPHVLKVTGRIAPWFEGVMAGLKDGSPRPERIELLGHVGIDELVQLYRDADALVVTSVAEGFGFPALEAMACGTPVVAYANSATAEVVAEGGVLVPDGDVTALVDALDRVLSDDAMRSELSAAAVARASCFSWPESVARHAEVLLAAAR